MVELLLGAGAKVNGRAATKGGVTALQGAAERGHVKVVLLLLGAGANFNPADTWLSSLKAAEGDGYAGLKTKLLPYLELDIKSYAGQNILHTLCDKGDVDFSSPVLESLNQKFLNCKDYLGLTPLHVAVMSKKLDMVKFLIKKHANLEIKDNSGRTALQVALAPRSRCNDIIKTLLQEGASTDGVPKDKLLSLLEACGGSRDTNLFSIQDVPGKGRLFAGINGIQSVVVSWGDKNFLSPSIYFHQ